MPELERARRSATAAQHVGLADHAAAARAGDCRDVDAALVGDAPRGGRRRAVGLRGGAARPRGAAAAAARRFAAAAPRLAAGARSALAAPRVSSISPSTSSTCTTSPSLSTRFVEHAGLQRRNFDGDLVGLELDQGVAGGNGIALLLEPPRDGGLDDRLAERGTFIEIIQ